jgi:thioredoxin reductase
VHALSRDGASSLQGAALIVANGAQERHLPFAGWERPGVMGLAAATVILKAQRVLPGRRVVVAGAGPLLLVVAKAIAEGGGRVVAIVDAHPRRAWLASVAALASRPDLVARGAGWVAALRRRRVPMLHGHRLHGVSGDAASLRAQVVPVDRNGGLRAGATPIELECDAVCCGYGLMPATDVTRLVGAAHDYDAGRGGWHASIDADQRCNLPRLYASGDVAGVVGAAAAPWQGRIAALAAALDLGRIDSRMHELRCADAKRARDRASRFGAAMTRLASIGDGAVASIANDVIMCQCEGLTRAKLETAIDDGCATLNDLRAATRCGMGPCGGRLCEDAAARLVAMRTGRTREAVGQPTGRPPLRPVALDALAGEFDYDALPIAAPSPL